jgi:hypothetical protein
MKNVQIVRVCTEYPGYDNELSSSIKAQNSLITW